MLDLPKKYWLQENILVYYTGDTANHEGIGIIEKRYTDRWGCFVSLKFSDGRNFKAPITSFSVEYRGNGSTRLVTLEDHNNFHKELAAERGYKNSFPEDTKLLEKKFDEALKIYTYLSGFEELHLLKSMKEGNQIHLKNITQIIESNLLYLTGRLP